MRTADAFSDLSGGKRWGNTTAALRIVSPTSRRTTRTSRTPDSSRGIGRTSSAACQVDVSESSARDELRRRASRATTITTARMGSMRSGLDAFHATPVSSTPSATALLPIAPRLVRRPSMSAASERSRMPRLRALVTGSPRMPARRNRAMKASSPASDQTTVCRRFTGTPSRLARSTLSAPARMAIPTAE